MNILLAVVAVAMVVVRLLAVAAANSQVEVVANFPAEVGIILQAEIMVRFPAAAAANSQVAVVVNHPVAEEEEVATAAALELHLPAQVHLGETKDKFQY